MRDDGAKLDGRRESALAALLSEPSIRDAAKRAKLSEATIYRYLGEPAFAERYKAARREVTDRVYVTVYDSAKREISDALERVLSGGACT